MANSSMSMDELQRENEALRDQVRRMSTQQTVARGAVIGAAAEKETTARLAHQVAVEERATRAAVEVQGSTISLSVMLQIVNLLMLLVLLVGLFAWLPQQIENRVRPMVVSPIPGTTGTPPIIVR